MTGPVRAFLAEARRVRRDGGALLLLVGAVLIYAALYPQAYVPEVLREVPTVVLDRDGSATSRQLARMADAHELVRVVLRTADGAAAERMIREGEAGAVLEIPREFERRLLRGEPVTVGAFADASYFLVYRQALTGLTESARTLSAGIEIKRLVAAGMPSERAKAAREPLPLVVRPLFNRAEGYASYIVPAVLLVILQQTLLIGIGLLGGTERAGGDAPRVAGPLATVLGRAGFYLALYAVHAAFYLLVVHPWFGLARRGALADSALVLLPFLLASIFLALAAGRLWRSREGSMQLLVWSSLPAVFLAGFAWPPEALPRWLDRAAQVIPSTPAIAAFLRVHHMGATLAHVGRELTTLWILAAVYFVLAYLAERHERK